jgi:type VI secretion system FHA domain protein
MILTLEVTGEQAEDLGAGSRRVFNSIGGTIGRLPDNDWVFPDPYVSGRHALIRYLNGKFFVEDTSTNGVFINTPDNRLSRDQPHQLKSGDTIYIDAYRIQVSIEKPENDKQKDDPFELLKARGNKERANHTVAMAPPPDRNPSAVSAGARARPPDVADEDRTAAIGRSNEEGSVEWYGIDMDDGKKPAAREAPAAAAAAPQPAKRAVPSPSRSTPPAPAPAPREAVPSKSTSASTDPELLAKLLTAAGITEVQPSAELAQTLGAVLRVAVGGVMEALRGRERMKDDMRLRGTTFKAQDNNPLKFSANVDDAFHNLLVKHNAAYLSPPDAFEDALRDVRDHQAATIAAMRLAFESTLAHFDPNRMQEDFDRQLKKGSILGVPAKLRYWDMYRDTYGELAKDGDASFRTLFAEEFTKAYEEQLDRLRAAQRNRQK